MIQSIYGLTSPFTGLRHALCTNRLGRLQQCLPFQGRTAVSDVLRRCQTRSRGHWQRSRWFCSKSDTPPRAVGLAWDVETTGYQPCEIVQIAVTCADWDDEPYSSFVRYVMPSVPIDPRAQKIHGISMELLLEQRAQTLEHVLSQLAGWLDSTFGSSRRLVWAAHNGNTFDIPVLRKCVAMEGCKMPRGLEPSAYTVDTLQLARSTLRAKGTIRSYALRDLYQLATGTPLVGAHDAHADAKAVATVSCLQLGRQGDAFVHWGANLLSNRMMF